MAEIFISYRRADASDSAGRMFDRLVTTFGKGSVFKDVDSIPLGFDFADLIAERLHDCKVVIIVIGPFWLTVRSQDGTPRLYNPTDLVRIEVEQSLKSRALVVPALVGNAAMPHEEELPPSIQKLTRKNAISIRPDPDFHRDMDRLIHGLQNYFSQNNSIGNSLQSQAEGTGHDKYRPGTKSLEKSKEGNLTGISLIVALASCVLAFGTAMGIATLICIVAKVPGDRGSIIVSSGITGLFIPPLFFVLRSIAKRRRRTIRSS
jgi:hypothetical protein